jgi:tRNA 2-thiouridine synthesizing protein A
MPLRQAVPIQLPMEEQAIKEVDARGLMCPEPLVEAQRAVDALRSSAWLRVLTTDPAAPIDFEVWCQRRGHRLLRCEAVEGGHAITIIPGG